MIEFLLGVSLVGWIVTALWYQAKVRAVTRIAAMWVALSNLPKQEFKNNVVPLRKD